MKRSLKLALLSLALLSLLSAAIPSAVSGAQSIPATVGSSPAVGSAPSTGFGARPLAGSFNYSLNASELISSGFFGGGGGVVLSTNLSGSAVYQSKSDVHPFNMVYTGGVLLENSGQPTSTYQNLSLSQSLRTKNWNFNVQDSVNYLPQSPVSGLSGIPGVGDLGISPIPVGPQSGIGILTTYGPRVSNTISGSASRYLTPHLSAQVSAYQDVQEFIGDNAGDGLNNSGEGGSAGLTYRFDQRDNLSANYDYSRFSFGTAYGTFISQGASVGYSRQWTRRFSTFAYVGPQFESSTSGLFASTAQIAAGASASFLGRSTLYTLNFSRGTNNGSGVIPGSFSNTVNAGVSRIFHRVYNVAGNLGYSRVSSLPGFQAFIFSSQAVTASGQIARALTRRLYGYASYTVEEQSFGQVTGPAANAFNGVYQIFAVGVSYSPRNFLFGK